MSDWNATYSLESDLKEAVESYLKQRGDVHLDRIESGGVSRKMRGRGAPTGTADFVGVVLGGRHLEIELKRPKKSHSSPEQIARRDKIRRMGGVSEECRTVAEVHDAIEKARGACG